MKQLIAVLDANKRLTGTKMAMKPGQDAVLLPDGCDLPMDGSYKWDGTCFVPLGHGFGPVVARPPVSETTVLYHLIDALGDKAPHPAREWADWYVENLKVRDEEISRRTRKPKIRR